MKKLPTLAFSLALILSVSGCGQTGRNEEAETTPVLSTTASSSTVSSHTEQTQQSVITDHPADEISDDEIYLGQWKIEKQLAFAPVSTFSNDDIRSIIGKKITFTKDLATRFGDRVEYLNETTTNPVYSKTRISKSDFEADYRVSFQQLGILGDSVLQVDVSDDTGNKTVFFVKDNDTLILSGGGVYLELKRIPALSVESALEAYQDILKNKTMFYSVDSMKEEYLDDFLTGKEVYEIIFEVTRFSVLDMDHDKVPEVVLELSVNDYPQFFEVLHLTDDTVRGCLYTYRNIIDLKEDGTFIFSSGAADTGVGRINFQSDEMETESLGYSESSQGETDMTVSYYIGKEAVSREAFDSFIQKQTEKENAVWYEFTEVNIETQLSAN